jgi:multiple sugar transport system substrate-binding protein
LLSDFHKLHPNIRIQPTCIQPGNFLDAFTDLLDREAVDVISINHQDLRVMVNHNCLDELEKLEPNHQHYPFLTETMMIDGNLNVQPFIFTPLVLCYNKDHFLEKRIPEPDSSWRWNDLYECANQLAIENKRLGFYCHLLSRTRWPVFLLQSGEIFKRNEQGKFKIRGTAIMDSIRASRDMVLMINRNPLILSENDADTEELFFNGKVSMIMTTYLSLNHQTKKPDFQFDVAPLPYMNEPKSLLQVIGLAVCSRSKEKDAANKFVEYMTSYRAQLLIRQKTLSIPASKMAAEWSGKENMYRPSRFYMYREIIPTFQVPTDLNITLREIDLFIREVKLYWSGLETEEAVCDRLEDLL